MAIDWSSHSTGYAIDHPDALASLTNPLRWDMRLLMAGRPILAIPDDYVDPDLGPRALDQDGVGACVMAAAETIKQSQDHKDWGRYLYTTGSMFLGWRWLKEGSPDGSYPGDGIDPALGSYPEAAWKLAKVYGLPDAQGRPHRITAYYSHTFASAADLEFIQQVILTFGPVNFGIPWSGLWSNPPAAPDYLMPPPPPISTSGHSITVGGWKRRSDGIWLACFQTWGEHWTNAQGVYYVRADWLMRAPLGPQIAWKTVDDPDAPAPPPPDPGGTMLTIVDKVPRLVDTTVGTPVYRMDGVTPLVTIGSGPLNISSPNALTNGTTTYFGVVISIGGVLQLGSIKTSACTNVRVMGDPAAATAAEHKRWDDWLLTAPK